MEGYYGKFKGIVKKNIDPEKLLRIKAIVPAINDITPLNWAYPCVDYLGAGAGNIKLPGIDDGVWIEFENGDVNYPIWVGMWAAAADVPGEFQSNYKEDTRLIKDKAGNYNLTKTDLDELKRVVDVLINLDQNGTINVANDLTIDANLINFNNGTKGVARLEDLVKSTSAEESTFWPWLTNFVAVFQTWVPVPMDGGAALKAALSAFIGANPAPQTLTSKIIESSDSVKAGD